MKKLYATLNLLVIVAVIIWNYVANAMGINGNTVGSLSDDYANLFTPAGYAFSIWGLIFLALLGHGIFLLHRAFSTTKSSDFILKMGPWLIIANLGNMAWIWFWLTEQTAITVGIMVLILVSLLTLVTRLGIAVGEVTTAVKRWVWWPISLYSGWISVALIANISAYLAKIEWQAVFSEEIWAVIMIIIATLVNLYMVKFRKMLVFAGVGAWALAAIAVKHWGQIAMLQWTALASCLVVVGVIVAFAITRR